MTEIEEKEKLKEITESVMERIDALLVEGRRYVTDIKTSSYGYSGGIINFYEDDVLITVMNCEKLNKCSNSDFEKHTEPIEDIVGDVFMKLKSIYPADTKIDINFEKGGEFNVIALGITELIYDLKNGIEQSFTAQEAKENGEEYRTEAVIRFRQEADELGSFIECTEWVNNTPSSYDFFEPDDNEIVKSIYSKLEDKPESLYISYRDNKIEIQSEPAMEQYGMKKQTIFDIELEPEFKKRKDSHNEAVKMRHDLFRSIGDMDERVLYLRIGGFRDHSWPEDSTTHSSAKMRVIYTDNSTILITDGLTDVYSKESLDENLEYNGLGVEFYMEFCGKVPFKIIHEHFAMALINTTSQIAIQHQTFKDFMLRNNHTTIEFRDDNIELWINKENHANHNADSFLVKDRFYNNDSFAVMLGTESKNVPKSAKLNNEEILFVNIKPVDSKWLTADKLRNSDNSKAAAAREAIIKEFKDTDEWNLVPVTYHDKYIESAPESDGIVTGSLFPFGKV
jgi:hypothetical protein